MKTRAANRDLVPALAFLLPNLLGFLLFTLGPVVFSLVMSFTDWNLLNGGVILWTGLRNYGDLLHDTHFWLYFFNTIYLMLGIPVAIAGSLLLAILLSQKLRGIVVYRTLFYLPSFTAGVALMILWKALYNPDFGPINAALSGLFHGLGLHAVLPDWLGSMKNLVGLHPEHVALSKEYTGIGARDALIYMGIWTAVGGNNMLLYLAALTNVPQDLYEAAQVDGAGRWALFRHVTWPQLAPTTFFIVIMSLIGGLQGGFDQARVMTGGGPSGTTTSLTYYIYTKAFSEFQMGYASTISWALFALIFVFTLVYWKLSNQEVNY